MTIARHYCISSRDANRNTAQTDVARLDIRSAVAVLPGVSLAGAIAAAALVTHHIPGMATFSPMILAIVIGMAFHNIVGTPSFAKPGIAFSLRRLLRFAVMLLGFQLNLTVIADVGARGLLIVAITVIAAALRSTNSHKWLQRPSKLASAPVKWE
jgi:uncharacterized membrane protein YadS